MNRLRPSLFALIVVACITLFGCSSPKQSATTTGAPKKRIAGIIFQEDQYFRLVLFGMRDAAKKNNVELLEGNSNNKPEKEAELVNTYASQGVDAIILSPLSAKGSVAALKPAADKGITIIAANTPIEGNFHKAYIESNAFNLGEQTGKKARAYIEQKMGGKATIAILAFKSLIPEQSDARTNGFKEQIKGMPGVKIVAEQDAWLPEQAVKKAGDILTAHPEIDLIWSANEGGTIGSVMAVKNAGKAGKIAVFGTDSSEQLVGFLKAPDGILQAITSQKPVDVGRTAVEFALKAMKGEPVEKHVAMTGICLSRDDPAGIAAFEKQLNEWMSNG